jgi:Transposase IS4
MSDLQKAYNLRWKITVASSTIIVLDEGMSAFQPRATKTSKLPKLSFIKRKPKPLGTEFKMAACPVTKINLYLEVQERPIDMKKKAYFTELGATAACSLRLIVGSMNSGLDSKARQLALQQSRKHLVIADSWFGSVKLAENLKMLHRMTPNGIAGSDTPQLSSYVIDPSKGENPLAPEIIACVKTNCGWFPLRELETKMKGFPAGSHLVMECVTPDNNIKLKAIGYKWNSSDGVKCFIMTANAASTCQSKDPYIARYNDKHQNVATRKVQRPEVVATYFRHANVIDVHNQSRQHHLGLETYWRTHDPWKRIQMTIIGMTAIDCLKGLRYHCPHFNNLSVEEYADYLAYDCIHNPYTNKSNDSHSYIAPDGSKLSLAWQLLPLWQRL